MLQNVDLVATNLYLATVTRSTANYLNVICCDLNNYSQSLNNTYIPIIKTVITSSL